MTETLSAARTGAAVDNLVATLSMKCPHCRSERLRQSRRRAEDGTWRSLLLTAYRCRDCRRRSQHLAWGRVIGVVSMAGLAILPVGLVFIDLRPAPSDSALAADGVPASAAADGYAANTASLSVGDASVAAAAEKGDAQAQLRLGMAYLNGVGVKPNLAVGLSWVERAAAQGLADAQYVLGVIHQSGRGTVQNFPVAFQWYERAAQQNHAQAQYRLGLMFRAGQGISADKSRAYMWFNLAAAQGHERAGDARDDLLLSLTREEVVAAQRAAQEWRVAKVAK